MTPRMVSSHDACSVGAKKDAELDRYLKNRSGFKALFFSDIVALARQRYQEFVKTILVFNRYVQFAESNEPR